MVRPLLAGLLAAGLVASAVTSGPAAQEKKEQPKKKERIAVADPKKAADDPDFLTQGEYEGAVTADGPDEKVGVHVVAKGEGQFNLKVYRGGLPGAGWNQKDVRAFTATRADGKVTVHDAKKVPVGAVADGVVTVAHDGHTATAKRVTRTSPTLGAKPPAGAVVLFGKPGDEGQWAGGKLTELADGVFLAAGTKTKDKFASFTAHVEFRTPWMPNSSGQQRGNSGVYLQDRYEVQVLDSFGLNGENNECGGLYTQAKPAVNMCLPPLAWQTYDITFTAAEFDADKKRTKPARLTVVHNGVKVHDDLEVKKETGGGQPEGPTPGPIQFQNHGDPVVFTNVWVVPTK